MTDIAVSAPTCRVCGGHAEFFCAACESSCFCAKHACRHISPEMLGVPKPERSDTTWSFWITAVLVLLGIGVAIKWFFSDSNGAEPTFGVLVGRGMVVLAILTVIAIVKGGKRKPK